jgi:hypothetical protein
MKQIRSPKHILQRYGFSIALCSLLVAAQSCNQTASKDNSSTPATTGVAEATAPVASKPLPDGLEQFMGLYHYWVPGTAYTTPDYTNEKEVLHTSAGSGVLPGDIRIEANGTYTWNSSWEAKVIKGEWRTTNDKAYPLELVSAQEGKNWKIGKATDGSADILVWDGSTWYNGKKIK